MKFKVPIFGTVGKSVSVESDAPSQAQVTAQIAAAVQNITVTPSPSVTSVIWRFIREVPANIANLAAFTGAGLLVRKSDSTYVARSVATAAVGDLTVTNGSGVAGNPTIALGADTVASLALADTAVQPADLVPITDATVLTENDETAVFANSRQLLAGTNITFDDTTPGERTVNASGGGGGSLTAARVHRSTSQSLNGSGDTTLQFDVEDYDTGSYVDLGTDNTKIVISATGFYMFGFFYHVNANGFQTAAIRLNGGSTPLIATSPASSSNDWRAAVAGAAPLTSGDYLQVVHTLFGSGSVDEQPNFWIVRVA